MHFWKDYLSQVFSTFWHALALTDTLVIGAFIVAGILAAFGFFGGHAEHPAWWIALAIFLVLLLVLLVKMPYKLYAEQRATIHSLNQRLTPKIRLSFHHDAEGLAKTPIQIRQEMFGTSQIKTTEFTATYVRIRVEAMSETAVTGCKAFLTKLEREDAGGKTVSDIALPHGVGLKGSQPFDVHPNVICTIDFLVCSSENDKLVVPESNWPLSLRSIFDDTGTYHFTITVNGGGISDSITVAVGWPGQWDKITAREVKHKDRSHYASI